MLKLVFENHTLQQESIAISKILSINLSSQYSELKVKIKQLSKNMDTSEESATNLKQGITFDLMTNIAATLFNEKKEKEKRQLNLILHSIKESNNADISKQQEENISAGASILGDYVNVPVSINGCFRIGKKCDDLNKPRLLKITVNSLVEKVAVLRNKLIRLRNQDNPEYIRKVFTTITPDLIPTEKKKQIA